MTSRPELSTSLTSAELRRWYWTLAELQGLARRLDVPRGGGKQALTERLAAALDGVAPAPPVRRAPAGQQLTGPLTPATVIPQGQRCSQRLREFFRQHIGPGFTFDAAMREFVAAAGGRTLGDAVAHWHATRAAAALPGAIGPQFEFNAFLRRRRQAHPGETRADALAAWQRYRALPLEERDDPTVQSPA